MTSINAWLEMWGLGSHTGTTTSPLTAWNDPYAYPPEIIEWLHNLWGFPRTGDVARRHAA